ncbi:MAG: EAL domain-containing protein [Synergistaceae bacterium]|nr:EAL domain-containing protein [Synergistaceae bacterium]
MSEKNSASADVESCRWENMFFFCDDPVRTKRYIQIIEAVFDNTVEGIVITDADGTIRMVNSAFSAITGYSPEEAIGKTPRILKSNRNPPEFYQEFWRRLLEEGHWEGEIWNRRKNGEVYPEWMVCTAVYDEDGTPGHFVSVFNDLSEVKFKDAQIELRSNFDFLTGLPNKEVFQSRLEDEIARSADGDRRLALLVFDINRFKNINDTLGHFAGDVLLKQVGDFLSECAGPTAMVSRIGGDDFHILVPDVGGPEDIAARVKKVLGCLREPMEVEGHRLFISASVGISLFPDDGSDVDELTKRADIAMGKAKESGISSYRFFTDELGVSASLKLKIENALREGLERDEFYMNYQPKYCIRRGELSGVEALLRWDAPDGPHPPTDFIPLAEETGLILPLGDTVFRKVFGQIAGWRKEEVFLGEVAVNLSPRQFHQAGLLNRVKALLDEYGVPPSALGIEVTESGIMENLMDSIKVMSELKELGMTIYIDDFGTGYSSLNYLKRLPIDALKIDKSFIDNVLEDVNDSAIVRAVIGIARSLGLRVVAEGVETREQLEFLRQNGCDEIQGYLLSKPLPPERFGTFLENEVPDFFSRAVGNTYC